MTAGRDADPEGLLTRVLQDASIPGVVSVYLFGSHGEGRAHRESDIDIAMLLDRTVHRSQSQRFDERVRLTSWLIGALKANAIDVVVLNDTPPLLARHIVTTGRRVYCADAALDHAFVRDAQLRAADIAPFLRRVRQVKLAAMAR